MRRSAEAGSTFALAAELTPREIEVLRRTAMGRTNAAVADLGVAVHAVKFHLASIYRKLHVQNRTEAAVRYLGSVGGGLHEERAG